MRAQDHRGASAPGVAAPPPADDPAAALTAGHMDEAPGWQAEGFRGQGKGGSVHSHGAVVLGQPASAGGPTMTSIELVGFINSQRGRDEAELRHDHFMARVPKVLGEGHAPKFRDMLAVTIGNGATRQSPIYRFPKREACLMAMSFSYELQARVFDRMTQLEQASAAPSIPRSFREALLLAAEQQAVIERQAAALAIAAPKASALDRIATATDGALCLRDVAKLAQVPEHQFFEFLRAEGWIFKHRGGSNWVGHSDKEKAGLLELKRRTFTRPDGTEGTGDQVLITPRGQTKIAELIERKAPHLRKARAAPASQQGQLALVPPPEGDS